MKKTLFIFGAMIFICSGVVHIAPHRAYAQLDEIKDVNQAQIKDGSQSQEKINKIDDQSALVIADYRASLVQLDSLREYNRQLEKLIAAQKVEMKKIRQQIEDVTTIDRTIIPHMFRMIEALEKFVNLDVPFLIEKRTQRIENLRELMDRSDANPAEKYRKILEAFEIENEYGRTIEAYEGNLVIDDEEVVVNFLRIGRVAWIYQTLDEDTTAVWRQDIKEWEEVSMDSEIRQAIRIAKEQAAPDLLVIPLPGATDLTQ